MKSILSISKAAKMLRMSKKDVKCLMIEKGWITTSGAITDGDHDGMVAELRVFFATHEETTLFLTVNGMLTLIQEVYHG